MSLRLLILMKVSNSKPDHAYTYLRRGCVKVELERYESTIADFDKSIKLDPDDAQTYFL